MSSVARPWVVGGGSPGGSLAAIATRHEVWLVPGSVPERVGDAVDNTAVVLDPAG